MDEYWEYCGHTEFVQGRFSVKARFIMNRNPSFVTERQRTFYFFPFVPFFLCLRQTNARVAHEPVLVLFYFLIKEPSL